MEGRRSSAADFFDAGEESTSGSESVYDKVVIVVTKS